MLPFVGIADSNRGSKSWAKIFEFTIANENIAINKYLYKIFFIKLFDAISYKDNY
jgi:hypothetical protein